MDTACQKRKAGKGQVHLEQYSFALPEKKGFCFVLPVLKPDSETFRRNLNNSEEKDVKVDISR